MAIEGVNSNSTLIQGTQTNNIAQQNNIAAEAVQAEGSSATTNSVESNTEQDNTNAASTGVNQDSEATNVLNEPGALLDVLA